MDRVKSGPGGGDVKEKGMPRPRDPDFENWLDQRGQEPPEPSPTEVEAEEQWIGRVSRKLRKTLNQKPKETPTCPPRKD